MKTLKIKENPQIEGKQVGDKCKITIEGTIKSIAKEPDYSETNGPIDPKKKPKEYVFYEIKYNPGSDIKTKEYRNDTRGAVEEIVDESEGG